MPEPSQTVLIFETAAGDPPVEFLGDSSDIVYFISMAHSERYGADHPLAKASSLLKRRPRGGDTAITIEQLGGLGRRGIGLGVVRDDRRRHENVERESNPGI